MEWLLKTHGLLVSQAAPAQAAPAENPLAVFAPMLVIFGIFYFLVIRPQQRKQRELKQKIEKVKKGDKVVTAGGICGTVAAVKDGDIVVLKIADNVRVDVVRGYIVSVSEGGAEPAAPEKA